MAGRKSNLEQLRGNENFAGWKVQMLAILVKNKCKKVIIQKLADGDEQQENAYGLVIESVSNPIASTISEYTNVYDVWHELVTKYETSGVSNQMATINQLLNMKFNDLSKIDENLTIIKNLYYKINNVADDKLKMSEHCFVLIVLHLLSSQTKLALPETLQISTADKCLRIEQVFPSISREASIKSHSSANMSSSSKVALKSTSKFCTFCRRKNHNRNECYRLKNRQNTSTPTNKNKNEDGHKANALMAVYDKTSGWILDSGASHHCCNDKSSFTTLFQLKAPVMINVFGKHKVKAKHSGTFEINTISGKLSLNGLYAPDGDNLISIPQLHIEGYKQTIDEDGWSIYKNGKLILQVPSLEVTSGLFVAYIATARTRKDDNDWHSRLGHIGNNKLSLLKKDFPELNVKLIKDCEVCAENKLTKPRFKKRPATTTKPLEVVYADLCGPFPPSDDGDQYIAVIIDDYSRHCATFCIKQKLDFYDVFLYYVSWAERQTGRKLKTLFTDNGGEFLNKKMKTFTDEHGIVHLTTTPHTPQSNGVAERKIRSLVTMSRCLINESQLPSRFWHLAVTYATILQNSLPQTIIQGKTPYKLLLNRDSNYRKLHRFGAIAYVKKNKFQNKFDSRGTKMMVVGFQHPNKLKLLNPETGEVIYSRNVRVFNHTLYELSKDSNVEEVYKSIGNIIASIDDVDSQSPEVESILDQPVNSEIPNPCETESDVQINENRPKRDVKLPLHLQDYMCYKTITIPETYKQAINDEHSEDWIQAMNDEFNQLNRLNVFEAVRESDVCGKVLKSRWLYKIKTKTGGSTDRFKARFVVKGFSQDPGVDFCDTYAPVASHSLVRLILSITAKRKWSTRHCDVKTAFLYADLKESIHIEPPPGYHTPNTVWKLNKSLYGLRQASKCWSDKLSTLLTDADLTQSKSDSSIYFAQNLIVLVYVDDLLISGKSENDINALLTKLRQSIDIVTFFRLTDS